MLQMIHPYLSQLLTLSSSSSLTLFVLSFLPSSSSTSSSVPPGQPGQRSHTVSYQQLVRLSTWRETYSVKVSGRQPHFPSPHRHTGCPELFTSYHKSGYVLEKWSTKSHVGGRVNSRLLIRKHIPPFSFSLSACPSVLRLHHGRAFSMCAHA